MDTNQTKALLSQVNPMVNRFAGRLASQSGGSVEKADLVQVGLIAALRCAKTFDASKGAAFNTYCCRPVWVEMKRATNASRSVTGGVTRCAAKDVSFSAPVSTTNDSEDTFGDMIPSDEESVEVQAMKAEREVKVREIVARVRKGFANKDLFDDLLARLMAAHFAGNGERLRSELPLRPLAEKHGLSRQGVLNGQNRIREVLSRALATIEEG